ncbi:MAG TPA: PAS domain S-box protein [Candidatus Methanoperedens sp.]
MSNHRRGIHGFDDYGNLIWISIGFGAFAWILDSLLDSLIFHEGAIIDQIVNPSIHETGLRFIFSSVFIIFGIYTQFGVTKLKQAEEALKAAIIKAEDEKNKAKAVIEAMGDGIILQDTDFKVIYQNQIQNEIYGNHVGEYCYKVYERRDTICEDCPIEGSFRDGKIHRTERSVATDNGILYFELKGSPLRDSAGKIIGGVKVIRDITESKRIEEALRESEKKYRALFEAAPVGIGIADLEGKVLDGNVNMMEMTGFTAEELKYRDVGITYVDPDERRLLIKTLKETGRLRDWEVKLKRKDGTIYYALLNVDLLELEGRKVLLTTARDITGRKQAEKEKDRFLKAFASSTDGITLADEKDRFIYVNEAYAMIFGYRPEELIGDTWRKITPPEMIAPTEKGLSTTMHARDIGIFSGEVPGLRKDGTIVPTDVRGNGLWDENGNYQGHICIVRDITKKKQAEEALRESEEKFRSIVEQSADGIVLTDEQGIIIEWNRGEERIIGLKRAEAVGRPLWDVQSGVATEEKKTKAAYEQLKVKMLELLRTGQSPWLNQLWETEIHRPDGTRRAVQVLTFLIKTGKGFKAGSISRDITERKRIDEMLRKAYDELESRVKERTAKLENANRTLQAEIIERERVEHALRESEDKYKTIFETTGTAILIIEESTLISLVNTEFEKLTGYSKEEVEGKRSWTEFVVKDDLKRMLQHHHDRRIDPKMVPDKYEFRLINRSGEVRDIFLSIAMIPGTKKSTASLLDITEKNKLEEQFLRAQRMESIGTLASGIAHDINNVLLPILLSLDLLKERFTDVESQKLINILERSVKRGASLIKQVQSFGRGIKGERIALQAGHLISEIRQIVQETFPRSIEIRTDIPKDLWIVSGDATQLHQVMMNLCVNARDAMPDGGTLGISAENLLIDENFARINIEARVGPYISITVSDTGTGIAQEIRGRIFEPFFTTKEPGKGTGLGLSTALGIVKSHGGFINVYSEIGNGTAFKVYLPAITTIETLKAEDRQPELSAGHGELILVVDDEPQILEITRAILEKSGYRVITARNGAEALALYNQNSYDVKIILMDMMMPVMDGPMSIRELHKANPEVRIIAVSGLTEKDKLEKFEETRAHAFLNKPYTTEKLLKTIQEIIRK